MKGQFPIKQILEGLHQKNIERARLQTLVQIFQKPQRALEEAKLIYQHAKEHPYLKRLFETSLQSEGGSISALYEICHNMNLEVFEENTVVIEEGTQQNGKLYVILHGRVKVFVKGVNWKAISQTSNLTAAAAAVTTNENNIREAEINTDRRLQLQYGRIVAELGSEHCFGEKALLASTRAFEKRNATCIAYEQTHCLVVRRQDYLRVLSSYTSLNLNKRKFLARAMPSMQHILTRHKKILDSFQFQHDSAGTIIFKEGQHGEFIYVLAKGQFLMRKQVSVIDPQDYKISQKFMPLQIISEGTIVGEDLIFQTSQDQNDSETLQKRHSYEILVESKQATYLKISLQNFMGFIPKECRNELLALHTQRQNFIQQRIPQNTEIQILKGRNLQQQMENYEKERNADLLHYMSPRLRKGIAIIAKNQGSLEMPENDMDNKYKLFGNNAAELTRYEYTNSRKLRNILNQNFKMQLKGSPGQQGSEEHLKFYADDESVSESFEKNFKTADLEKVRYSNSAARQLLTVQRKDSRKQLQKYRERTERLFSDHNEQGMKIDFGYDNQLMYRVKYEQIRRGKTERADVRDSANKNIRDKGLKMDEYSQEILLKKCTTQTDISLSTPYQRLNSDDSSQALTIRTLESPLGIQTLFQKNALQRIASGKQFVQNPRAKRIVSAAINRTSRPKTFHAGP